MNRDIRKAYVALMKPRIVSMSLVALAMGYYLGAAGAVHWVELLATIVGAGLIGSGASALNHYMEREQDALMERTKNRPLPSGLLRPNHVLIFGVYLVLWGLGVLLVFVNLITSFLLLLSAFLYVLVYTPMKRMSWLNTTVGAIPGAIPPLAGWTATTDEVSMGGVILFAILFAWQHTHFYAIAWMYRDDYERAGFRMLSAGEDGGSRTAIGVLMSCALLLIISALPFALRMAGPVYLGGAIAFGALMAVASIKLARARNYETARGLLRASIYYLPAILAFVAFDAIR